MSLVIAALFFVLTPGVLVSLPPGKGKFVVAATHAAIFALVFHFTHKTLMDLGRKYELFESPSEGSNSKCTPKNGALPKGGSCCRGTMVNVNGICM